MIAFDTNVLIYCCDKGDPRRQAIALDLVSRTGDGVIPWQVACEFIAASRKLGSQGFTVAEAWQRLSEFLALFALVLPNSETLAQARVLHTERQWAFWDAMLVASCLAAGVTCLYTEDIPSRPSLGELEFVNPFK